MSSDRTIDSLLSLSFSLSLLCLIRLRSSAARRQLGLYSTCGGQEQKKVESSESIVRSLDILIPEQSASHYSIILCSALVRIIIFAVCNLVARYRDINCNLTTLHYNTIHHIIVFISAPHCTELDCTALRCSQICYFFLVSLVYRSPCHISRYLLSLKQEVACNYT